MSVNKLRHSPRRIHDETEAAKREIARLSGQMPRLGRNPLDGRNTNRIYGLLNNMLSDPSRRRLIQQDEIL